MEMTGGRSCCSECGGTDVGEAIVKVKVEMEQPLSAPMVQQARLSLAPDCCCFCIVYLSLWLLC